MIISELDNIRFPLSLDELPQFIPYLDCLYNVVNTIHRCCYTNATVNISSAFNSILELKVINAIMEKSSDRTRHNCFYHPYH